MAQHHKDSTGRRWDLTRCPRNTLPYPQDVQSYSPQNPRSWGLDRARRAFLTASDSKCSHSPRARRWSLSESCCAGQRSESSARSVAIVGNTEATPAAFLAKTHSRSASDELGTIVIEASEQSAPSSRALLVNMAGSCYSR